MAAASVVGSTHPLVCIITKVLISDSKDRSLPKISVCFRYYSMRTKGIKPLDLELWEPWVWQLGQLKQIRTIFVTHSLAKKSGISVLQGWLLTMKKYMAGPLTTMAGHFYSRCDNVHDQIGAKWEQRKRAHVHVHIKPKKYNFITQMPFFCCFTFHIPSSCVRPYSWIFY